MRHATFVVAALMMLAPQATSAQDLRGEMEAIIKNYLATHPDEVGEIVKDYFLKHPEAITQILAGVLKQRAAARARPDGTPGANSKAAAKRSAAVASNAALLSSPRQVTLGNPRGDVTLVEFFDYGCVFCKRALSDMLALMKDDQNLKIVLKELPILGPGSTEAARVSIAVGMQDPGGAKYLAFHRELLSASGAASKERALAAAANQGLDMQRLERDMASDEVTATLVEARDLAVALGISGTPAYVIGDNVVFGVVGKAALKGKIEAARGRIRNEQAKGR